MLQGIATLSILDYHYGKGQNQMLIFGHVEITLGTAVLLNGTLTKGYSLCAGDRASWLASLGNRIDIRLLLLGSLLPEENRPRLLDAEHTLCPTH